MARADVAARRERRTFEILRYWQIAAVSAVGLLMMTQFPSFACRVASQIKPSMHADKPTGDNYQLIAKVHVIELIEPFKFKNAEGEEIEPRVSFTAIAKVTESVKGVNNDQVIRLMLEGSSCNVPFHLNESGYVAANSVEISDGQVVAYIE